MRLLRLDVLDNTDLMRGLCIGAVLLFSCTGASNSSGLDTKPAVTREEPSKARPETPRPVEPATRTGPSPVSRIVYDQLSAEQRQARRVVSIETDGSDPIEIDLAMLGEAYGPLCAHLDPAGERVACLHGEEIRIGDVTTKKVTTHSGA